MTAFTAHNQSKLDEILSNTDFSCDALDATERGDGGFGSTGRA